MAAKKYSAGAIFLQVVPVFANVQRAIEDEAKNIDRALGDRMEQAGEKAGTRAGKAASESMAKELKKGSGQFERDFHKNIDGINRALDGIDTKRLSNNLRRELTEVKRELEGLKDVDIVGEADFRRVYGEITTLEQRVRGLRDGAKIVFRSDIDQALKGFSKIEAAKEAIEDPVEIEVKVDTGPALREMTSFEKSFKKVADRAASHLTGSMNKEAKRLKAELKYLENLRIGVDISANQARKELGEIMAELEAISQNDPDIDVKVDSGRAFAELAAFSALVDKVDGDDVNVDVNVRGTDAASRGLRGVSRDGDTAANSFRSFNIMLLAAAGAGPALIPILAGIAGGLLALGPAAGVAAFGLGAVLVGFSGIGDAISALQDRQDAMASGVAQAAATEQSSARAVADARRSAARAVESALDQQAAAQERYRDSIEDVHDAEEALRQAREAAKGTGKDINEQISDNSLAQDQGLLDVFNATVEYNAVMADGSSTNAEQEQARINLEMARDALADLRKEAKELAKEKKKWDKEGVNGTEAVEDAQSALNDAIEAQKDAYEDLGEAAEAVDQARADGARSVADAMRSQAEAMDAVTTQQQAVQTAFDKLGPAGERFALFLFGLREGFYEFRDDIQAVLLPAVQDAIEGFLGSKSASVARSALVGLAAGFGRLVQALSASFQAPAWLGFFEMLRDIGPSIQDAWGRGFIAFMEAMASMMTTLAPFALDFARGFERMMEAFAGWASSKGGQDALLKFVGYIREVGPSVLEFVGAFASALSNVLVALAPYGAMMLDILTAMLDYIAGIDPQILGVILGAVLALILASQIAYSVMNLLLAGAALLSSTVGVVIFALIAFGLAVAYLYRENEAFRDFIDEAWTVIKDAFVKAWEDHIKPALEELWEALKVLWEEVLQPLFEWLAPIIIWIAKKIIPLLGWAVGMAARLIADWIENWIVPALKFLGWWFKKVFEGMKWVWEHILKPVWKAIQIAARVLWEVFLKPAFEDIREGWDKLMKGLEWVWEHVLKPVWDAMKTGLNILKDKFRETVDNIKGIWENLQGIIGRPIRFVIETILNNGLIAGFNRISKAVGSDVRIPDIPVPEWTYAEGGVFGRRKNAYATGGVLPGYTPGRDVHQFQSPTGGRLNLSGGEAVMRPEFTRAVGTGFVDNMNALARSGGVGAVKRALGYQQSFARGGKIVFPLPGGYINRTPYNLGHDGVDINHPNDASGRVPFFSATSGKVTTTGYDRGYGNAVFIASPFGELVYGHSVDGSIGVSPGQVVRAGQYLARVGNTGNSDGAHLHFGFPGGTFGAAMGLLGGSGSVGADAYGDVGSATAQSQTPMWLLGAMKNPAAYFAGTIKEPLQRFAKAFVDSPVLDILTAVPKKLANMAADGVKSLLPGGKNVGPAVSGFEAVTGVDVPGLATGGIYGRDVPYNGTMKYDSGGYLPPGLTTVMNLTGKPEPVFTNDQWDNIEVGEGGNIHYEPHFEGSDLTAEDVAGDLNFTFRRISRGGKYERAGRP